VELHNGQITDTYPDPQSWVTNVPGLYGVTMQNRAGPNTAGKGNVGGEAQEWKDSSGQSIATVDDRGFLSNRASVGIAGELKFFPWPLNPVGYLACNGQAVSRSDYSALFSAIGSNFGNGNGSTTFNVPNYSDVVFGAIGGTFNNPVSTFGSNAEGSLEHFHGIGVHNHSAAHHHVHTHIHTYNRGHAHPSFSSKTQDLTNSGDGRDVTSGVSTRVSHKDHYHTVDIPAYNVSDDNTGTPSAGDTWSYVNDTVSGGTLTGNNAPGNTQNGLVGATYSTIQATRALYVYIKT